MLNRSSQRTWVLLGAAGVLAVIALGWFFLIRPESSSQGDLLGQASDARSQAAVSRTRVAGLRAENEKLPAYRAELATLQRALPRGAGTAAFVSDMQALSRASGVTITAINVTPASTDGPAQQTVGGATPLPITVSASGSPVHLEHFLDLLQNKGSRAVLIGQVTESIPTKQSSDTPPTLTIGMKAFFTTS
jgi:Tfp pilus assembly protein PilO